MTKPETWESISQKEYNWAYKTHTSDKFDIVAVGDSRVNIGIVPSVIEEELGLRTLNFGYSAAGLTQELILGAVDKLDRSGAKILLLGISPASLSSARCENESFHEWQNLTSYQFWKITTFNELMYYFDPISPIDYVYGWIDKKQGLYTQYGENGWRSVEIYPRDRRALVGYQSVLGDSPISQEVIENLLVTIDSCVKRDVRVVAFRVPSIPEMWALEDSLSRFDTFRIPEGIVNNGGEWIEFETGFYESVDASHLARNSAFLFSQVLADSLESKIISAQ